MKPEQYPRCNSCGQRHAWMGSRPDDPVRGALTGPLAALGLILAVCFVCGMVGTCQGAVVITPINVTLRDTGAFQLHPASSGPEFLFTFGDGLAIERNWTVNKQAKIVGYHPSYTNWEGTAARLIVGDTVEWKNYAGTNFLRTDMPPLDCVPDADFGWFDRPAADWKPGMEGYFGLLTDPTDGEGVYYGGWLLARWNADSSLTLLESAYETEAGVPLVIVPEPTSVFIFFALAALLLLRRNRTDHHHENQIPR